MTPDLTRLRDEIACVICQGPLPTDTTLGMCRACGRSFDRAGSSVFSMIEWAAKRARKFALKRAKSEGKGGVDR